MEIHCEDILSNLKYSPRKWVHEKKKTASRNEPAMNLSCRFMGRLQKSRAERVQMDFFLLLHLRMRSRFSTGGKVWMQTAEKVWGFLSCSCEAELRQSVVKEKSISSYRERSFDLFCCYSLRESRPPHGGQRSRWDLKSEETLDGTDPVWLVSYDVCHEFPRQ